MPIIYQSTSSYSSSANWDDPTVWDGGIVPSPADTVYMFGTRLTIGNSDFSAGGYAYAWLPWTGSLPQIKISNTASLRPTGSLFVRTDRGLEVKINYTGAYSINVSNHFITTASIDTSFNSWSLDIYPVTESWPSKKGGAILAGTIMYQPPTPLIITGSITPPVTCSADWYIGRKASLTLKDPNFGLNGYLEVEDGDLIITGSGLVEFKRHYTSSAGPLFSASMIYLDDWYEQNLIIHGPEVRLNTQIQNPPQIGDGFISVVNTTGFAVGDYIFVGKDPDFVSASRTDDNFIGAAMYQSTMSSQDEAFRVAGISAPSTIYVQRYTGLDAKIASSASSTEIFVDDERYQVGDKVVINNQVRTIVSASIEDILVKDYDFTNPSTTLAEWETDVTRSLYFNNWNIVSGLGLTQFISTTYRHIFIKDLFLDKFKIEAWVSNLDQVTTGVTTPGSYGIFAQALPQADQYRSINARTYFSINPLEGTTTLDPIGTGTTSNTYQNRYFYTSSLALNGLKKMTIEASKGFIKGALEDKPIFEYFVGEQSIGAQWGRVGMYVEDNQSTFVCTRYRVHQKFQKLTLDQATTFDIGHKVYGTGVEYTHDVGERVIKLASMITTGSVFQDNLLFAYRGHSDYAGDSIYPMINSFNRTEAFTASEGSNLDIGGYLERNVNTRYGNVTYTELGAGLNKSVILDLGTERTFNNIAWNDWTDINFATAGRPINISGSNNGVTWSVISGSFFDNRPNFISIDNLRDFTFPSQSFRYIRIETNGDSSNNNRFYQWYVRYLTGSNRIYVNNTYDYPIGSEIGIVHNTTLNTKFTPPINTTGLNYLIAGTSSWVGDTKDHYVVTNTGSNYIDLDRPYNETILPQNDALIVRLDRQLKFSGSWDVNSWRTGRISGRTLSGTEKRQSFRNVSFQHMNSRYPFLNNADYGPFNVRSTSNYYNLYNDMTGCTIYNSFDNDYGANTSNGHGWIYRHNFMTGFRVPMQSGTMTYLSNLRKPWLWTGNIYHNMYGFNGGFEQNYAPAFYNYNIHASFNTYVLPSPIFASITGVSPNYNFNNTSTSQKLTMIRNIGRKSLGGIFISPSPTLQSIEEVTIKENILDYPYTTWRIDHGGIVYGILQKMVTPFMGTGRRGVGFDRAPFFSTSYYNHGTTRFPAVGSTPVNKIENYERLGYTILPQGYTTWVQETGSVGYKVYSMGRYTADGAYTGIPWTYNYPIVSMDFELQGTTASVDISFDYKIPATDLMSNVSYPALLGGNDLLAGDYGRRDMVKIVVYKNGNEVYKDAIFATTTELRNFSKTYNISGPGEFKILLTQPLLNNYVYYNNFSSRVAVSDLSKFTMIRNGFESTQFRALEYQIGRMSVVQTPQAPIFRLRGSRIR
jgi:hypothetical protein